MRALFNFHVRDVDCDFRVSGIHLTPLGPKGSVSAAWKITLAREGLPRRFTFRFHRRMSRQRGKLLDRLRQQAVCVEPVPFSRLVVPRDHHG